MDTYNIFISLSIVTDVEVFYSRFISQGKTPFHDLKKFNWKLLCENFRNVLIDEESGYRSKVNVSLFNDSCDSASKPMLGERHLFKYLKTLVSRAQEGNFLAHDLRDNNWCTTHKKSAPPQDFNGMITVQDDGSADVIEYVMDSIVRHFFSKSNMRGLMIMPLLFSGKLMNYCYLSDEMLNLFVKSFDGHPFANDVAALFFNDGAQKAILKAKSMAEFESVQKDNKDDILSKLGLV
jgi:hypothetical protein